MSNKRRRRDSADAEFYVYAPGVAVPPDATHVLVPVSVWNLPYDVFWNCRHLKEVVLPEGLIEIDAVTFEDCRLLERINLPSTLERIGAQAFQDCVSLRRLVFPDGLTEITEIAERAFCGCSSLVRISLPSSVTTVDAGAFSGCSSLQEVTLVDGIRKVGDQAFKGCALKGVILPATLVEIGSEAFKDCESLRTVKVCGAIQLIKRNAFLGCHALVGVRFTSKCLVITNTRENDGFNYVTAGSIPPTADHERLVITSECFYSLRSAEASALEIAITEILEMSLEWDEKCERLRRVLAPRELRRKKEVASILELALWKAEMQRSGGTGPGAREACRVVCGADVIVKNVVPFL